MVDLNRRKFLQYGGLAAVLGAGGAVASSAFDDEEGVPYDAAFYSDHYAQKNPNSNLWNQLSNVAVGEWREEPIHSIVANRAVRQIGYSSPTGDISHGICAGENDGYLEHRFIATHFGIGTAEDEGVGATGIPANKRTQIVLEALGSVHSTAVRQRTANE